VPEEKESQLLERHYWTNPYVGIDVSKATLDVAALRTVEHFVVPNDEVGIEGLHGRSTKVVVSEALVISEASRRFEPPLPQLWLPPGSLSL